MDASVEELTEVCLSNWREAIHVLASIRIYHQLKLDVIIHSLVLFSEYPALGTASEVESKLYYTACLGISFVLIDITSTGSGNFLHAAGMDAYSEQFIAIRNQIVLQQVERLHRVRKSNTLITLLCILWHPYFTTISDEDMLHSQEDSILSKNIIGSLQELTRSSYLKEVCFLDKRIHTLLLDYNLLPRLVVNLSYRRKSRFVPRQLLGKYEKVTKIGEGWCGTVMLASYESQDIAVKKTASRSVLFDCIERVICTVKL